MYILSQSQSICIHLVSSRLSNLTGARYSSKSGGSSRSTIIIRADLHAVESGNSGKIGKINRVDAILSCNVRISCAIVSHTQNNWRVRVRVTRSKNGCFNISANDRRVSFGQSSIQNDNVMVGIDHCKKIIRYLLT